MLRTIIADPAPTKRDTAEAHGAPLGAEEVRQTKAILGWPRRAVLRPRRGACDMGRCRSHGAAAQASWQAVCERYRSGAPAIGGATIRRELAGDAARRLGRRTCPTFTPRTRAGRDPAGVGGSAQGARGLDARNLVGGSADLAGSTGTATRRSGGSFGAGRRGPDVHWGIREHAMAACMNGMAAHGGVRPFGSTFLVFTDYMKPSIRLAALMGLPVIYIGTHDSIGVGEDGPTHQPIEHLAMLRAIPNW